MAQRIDELAEVSAWLRKEREFSFYGDIDFLPTEEYSRADALRAIEGARLAVHAAELAIPPVSDQRWHFLAI